MISYAGKSYWNLCQQYRAQPDNRHMQALLLNGEALLVLQELQSESVQKRARAFIGAECARLGMQDRSHAFLKQ